MRAHIERNVGILVFLVVWAALLAWFWVAESAKVQNMELIYSFGAFFVLLPASALVSGVVCGRGEGRVRFAFPILAGILEILLDFLTFHLINVAANKKWNTWDALNWDQSAFLFSFIPALVGFLAGMIYKRVREEK